MKTITHSCIRLDVCAQSKEEAIQRAGQLLADADYSQTVFRYSSPIQVVEY